MSFCPPFSVINVRDLQEDKHNDESEWNFIFMVRFGQFPENGQRQIAYINNFHRS